jgi:arylsulfatase A-like enzyme
MKEEQLEETRISYWQVFRLFFTIFLLYLMGDAFYRWDGFRYYGSFSEFLPSIALVTVLWSIVALFTAMLIWILLNICDWTCQRVGFKVEKELLLLFLCFFAMFGTMIWFGKKFLLTFMTTSYNIKQILMLCVFITTAFFTWVFRNKAKQWIDNIQERITPLLWLFGIFTVFSLLLVTYHTWIEDSHNAESKKIFNQAVSDKKSPNIILITFDALTSRDMSVYGYDKHTTPFISEWAKSASLFTRVVAGSNYTVPTTASLMTGKRVWTHQSYHSHSFKPIKSDVENLPLMLKDNGYYTMAYIVNPLASVKALGIDSGIDFALHPSDLNIPSTLFTITEQYCYRIFGDKIHLWDWFFKRDFIMGKLLKKISETFSQNSETEVPPEKAFKSFLSILDEGPPEPFFAWIHLYPPHDPYLPPEPDMGKFNSSSDMRTFKSQASLLHFRYRDYPQKIQPIVDILRSRYDEFIRYCDKQFKDFITQLEKRNIFNDSIIIMSSDHGESFEHNYLAHGYSHLYEQATHIPLIIMEPEQTKGLVIKDLIEQVDIPVTILDLAGINKPSWMEGRSIVPLLRGSTIPSKPVLSMNLETNPSNGHQITSGTIAVWEGDYKLIHYIEKKESLLFNLKQDPDELNNLFENEHVIGQRLLSIIQDNLEKANDKIDE